MGNSIFVQMGYFSRKDMGKVIACLVLIFENNYQEQFELLFSVFFLTKKKKLETKYVCFS